MKKSLSLKGNFNDINKSKINFLIIFIGKLLQMVIMFFTMKISTHLLSPKEMGNIYLFITVYTFFILFFINPLSQYMYRHINTWKENQLIINNLSLYFLYVLGIATSSILIGYIMYILGIVHVMNLKVFLTLLFGFILFVTLNQTIIPLLNMLHYRLIFTVLTVLTSFGILLFGYMFIIYFGYDAQNWLFGTLLANLVFAGIGFFVLRKKLQDTFAGFLLNIKAISKSKIKSILKFILPLSFATLFMWLQNSGYRIIIEKNINLEFLGFLGVGLAVSGQVAGIIESIAMQYFHPIYYQRISNTTIENRKKAINSLINNVLPIYLMLAIFLTFLSKNVLEILVDEKYYTAYIFTMFGIWIEFFRMTTNLFGNISQSEMNTKKFMIPYIVGSITTTILVYFSSISNKYSIDIPISLLVGGFVTLGMMYVFMKQLIDFTINYKLLFLSFLLSLPYASVYFLNIKTSMYSDLLLVALFGTYFLGTLFFIYKRGLKYDYS